MKRFFGLVALFMVVALTLTACGDKNSSILKVDGKSVKVYNTEADAESFPMRVAKGSTHSLEVGSDAKITGKALQVIPVPFIVKDNGTHGSKHEYTMDLALIPFHTVLIIEIVIGGQDTFIGKRMFGEDNAEKYYLAVEVVTDGSIPSDAAVTGSDDTISTPSTNPTPDTTTSDTTPTIDSSTSTSTAEPTTMATVPNGAVYFGEDKVRFVTYSSEYEAQQAAALNGNSHLPAFMVQNGLTVTAEPDPGTARIRVKVCLVDGEVENNAGARLNKDSNWSGVLDVQEYSGHQITFMLHAESASGFSNGYTYVSVYIP